MQIDLIKKGHYLNFGNGMLKIVLLHIHSFSFSLS